MSRFTNAQIESFKSFKIPLDYAIKINKRFNHFDIISFFRSYEISDPEIINEFDKRFSAYEIKSFFEYGIFDPKLVNKFDERFTEWEISNMIKKKIPAKIANEYSPEINIGKIIHYYKNNIYPDDIGKYDSRIRLMIDRCIRKGLNSKETSEYREIFSERCLSEFIGNDKESIILPIIANSFSIRFSGQDIRNLFNEKIENQLAIKYHKRFNGEDIAILCKAKVPFNVANKYMFSLNVKDIIKFHESNYKPSKINCYGKFLRGEDIFKLVSNEISPKIGRKYYFKKNSEKYLYQRFKGECIVELVKNKIDPYYANSFNENLNGQQISELIRLGFKPEDSKEYKRVYYGSEDYENGVFYLIKNKIPAQIANEFNGIDAKSIELLYNAGIRRDFLPNYKAPSDYNRTKGNSLEFHTDHLLWRIANQIKKNPYKDIKFISYGAGGVSLICENLVWKFALEQYSEIRLHQKLTNSENVANYLGTLEETFVETEGVFDSPTGREFQSDVALVLEYIKGPSLENRIEKTFSNDEIIKYSKGILNGLIEMRLAGIYHHRDIRPANIMIDEENNKAVIIDLGIATTNKKFHSQDNRRYGGPNDLTSLGQVIYKMATGNHLFAKSKSMEETVYADQLKEHRDFVYESPRRVKYYLDKVDKNVEDEGLASIIKECLTAKSYQYGKIRRMFENV